MAVGDAGTREYRKAFWRKINSNYVSSGSVPNLESLLGNLSSDEITGQLEKCKYYYICEKLGARILESIANSENKEITQQYCQNLRSVLSALNSYNERAAFYLVADEKLGCGVSPDSEQKKTKNLIDFLSNPEMVRGINKLAENDDFVYTNREYNGGVIADLSKSN